MAETDNLSQEAKNVKLVLDAVKGNPDLGSNPDIKNLVDMASGTPAPTEVVPPANTAESVEKTETTETKAPVEKTPPAQSEERSSVFYKESTEKTKSPTFSTSDDVDAHVSKKYSINTNDEGGWGTFFNSVDKWRNDAQKLDDANGKLEEYTKSFENMPDNLFNSVNAWANGDDWEKAWSEGPKRIDYSKPFEDQNQLAMLEHYFPGDFTEEDLSYKESDPTVTKGIKLAEKQYDFDRKSFEKKRAQYVQVAEEKSNANNESIKGSVEALSQVFPDMDKNAVNKIRTVMKGGDLSNILLNKDGTWKTNAASKIAYMLYGEDEIKRRETTLSESQNNLNNIVDRGSNQPNVKGKTAAPLSSEVEGALKMFDGLVSKRTY